MSERPMLSAAALASFSAYLPSDLTEAQAERCIDAARSLAAQVWREATEAQAALTAIRREYRSVPATETEGKS